MQRGTELSNDIWCVISNFEVLTKSEKSIFICIRKRIFPSFSSFLPNCKRTNIWWDISQIVHVGRRFPTVWMIIYHRERWTDVQKESGTSFEPIRALELGISKTMSTQTEKPYTGLYFTPLSHRPTEGQNFVWGWVPVTAVCVGMTARWSFVWGEQIFDVNWEFPHILMQKEVHGDV